MFAIGDIVTPIKAIAGYEHLIGVLTEIVGIEELPKFKCVNCGDADTQRFLIFDGQYSVHHCVLRKPPKDDQPAEKEFTEWFLKNIVTKVKAREKEYSENRN